MRWPYYLGHALRQSGDSTAAVAAFETVQALSPTDVASRVWLGDLYASLDRPNEAIEAYTEAVTLEPDSAPARIGLGKAELTLGNAETAIEHLEAALASEPAATAAHAPLGQAYRQLGNDVQASAHLPHETIEMGRLTDPLIDELPALLQTAQAFENRAFLAANEGNWEEAAAQFRQAAALAPGDMSTHMNLGRVLVTMGDGNAARQAFLAAERVAPQNPDPQFSLARLYVMAGRYRDAIERFERAAAYDPTMTIAVLSVADTLRQSDRPAAALPIYAELLVADEDFAAARFGAAIAMVQLNRWDDALQALFEGMNRHPDDAGFAHATARLLAAAPDDTVRNGLFALEIMSVLIDTQPNNIEIGETMAMTMAENEIWVDAINWQRGTIEGARELGVDPAMLEWLNSNLARYEQNEPARMPWSPYHTLFQPGGPPQPDLLQ
jgi:tetratricopeptide (TPR) repeat protein